MSKETAALTRQQVLQQFSKILAQAKSSRLAKWSKQTVTRALSWALLAERAKKKQQTLTPFRIQLLGQVLLNPFCPSELAAFCSQKLTEQQLANVEERREECEKRIRALTSNRVDLESSIKRVAAKRLLSMLNSSEAKRAEFTKQVLHERDAKWIELLQIICTTQMSDFANRLWREANQ